MKRPVFRSWKRYWRIATRSPPSTAGDELGFPGSLFLSHFNRARDAGWHITVHAGEAAGPESIWQAIRELGAERIGHGVKAIEDRALMDFLAEQRIESNPA